MSYEGYHVYECQLGHQTHYDVYDLPDKETWNCPGEPGCNRCGMPPRECGAMLGRYQNVDQTNGFDDLGWTDWAGSSAPVSASIGEQLGMKKGFHLGEER